MKTPTRTFLFYLILMSAPFGRAQEMTGSDSLPPLPVAPAVWRSTVLPGWGQIYQERLANAAVFSISTITLYLNGFYYMDQYSKYRLAEDQSKYTTFLSAAVLLHFTNIIDAADAAVHEKPVGWNGSLLGDRPLKSPWGAALRSMIIPGWGQIYNRSYFKAVLAIGASGYFIYKARDAHQKYLDTRDITYLRDRSKFTWFFGLAYLLNMADAYAGAYLFRFDDAMRLTLVPQAGPDFTGIAAYVAF